MDKSPETFELNGIDRVSKLDGKCGGFGGQDLQKGDLGRAAAT